MHLPFLESDFFGSFINFANIQPAPARCPILRGDVLEAPSREMTIVHRRITEKVLLKGIGLDPSVLPERADNATVHANGSFFEDDLIFQCLLGVYSVAPRTKDSSSAPKAATSSSSLILESSTVICARSCSISV